MKKIKATKSIWTGAFILVFMNIIGQATQANDTSVIKIRGNPIYFIDGVRVNSDTCNKNDILELEKKYRKAKKRKKKKYEAADLAFQIAGYYRLKNDTLYLTWYKRNIETNKSLYVGCDKNEIKHNILSQTGYSYYYTKEYKIASQYFNKAIAFCRLQDAEKDLYFLGLCLFELGQYSEAILEFNNYLKLYPNDKKDAEDLIKKCNGKINGR